MPKPNQIHYEKAFVVRINRIKQAWFAFGVLFVVLSIPLATYYGTVFFTAKENRELVEIVVSQENLIDELKLKIKEYEQLNANANLSLEVDRTSFDQIRKEMVASQVKIEMLGEQIQFYQSLMDPNPEKGGVYIETCLLYTSPSPRDS